MLSNVTVQDFHFYLISNFLRKLFNENNINVINDRTANNIGNNNNNKDINLQIVSKKLFSNNESKDTSSVDSKTLVLSATNINNKSNFYSSKSSTTNMTNKTTASMLENDLKFAYEMNLLFWYKVAMKNNNNILVTFIKNLMTDMFPINFLLNKNYLNFISSENQDELTNRLNKFYNNLNYTQLFSEIDSSNYNIKNSFESIIMVYKNILVSTFYNDIFDNILKIIIYTLNEQSPTIRSKSLKFLSLIIQTDKSLIDNEIIKKNITNRLFDKFISVREETVKLIGNLILNAANNDNCDEILSNEYLENLKYCLHDEGISVRKSVVNIFKTILLNYPNHLQYKELCLLLLERLVLPKEEETIKEIIRNLFQLLWFSPPSQTALAACLATRSKIVKTLKNDIKNTLIKDENNVEDALPIPCSLNSEYEKEYSSPLLAKTTATTIIKNEKIENDVVVVQMEIDVLQNVEDFAAIKTEKLEDTNNAMIKIEKINYDLQSPTTKISSLRNNTNTLKSPCATKINEKNALCLFIETTSLQLLDLISSPSFIENNNQTKMIEQLLRDLLHGKGVGDEVQQQIKQKRLLSISHCEKIVDYLMEYLLKCEEQDIITISEIESKQINRVDRILHVIILLSMFCDAHPPLVNKHLTTLLPYLKGDLLFNASQNSTVCLKVTQILSSLAVLNDFRIGTNIGDVLNDLQTIALKHNGVNSCAAICCIVTLIKNVTNDFNVLFILIEKCFTAIKNIVSQTSNSSLVSLSKTQQTNNNDAISVVLNLNQNANLQRCLIVLGFICGHIKECSAELRQFITKFNDEKLLNKNDNTTTNIRSLGISKVYLNTNSTEINDKIAENYSVLDINYLHPCAIFGCVYTAIMFALTVNNIQVQVRAVQALCGVFTGYPRLMSIPRSTQLFSIILSSKFSEAVHEKFIVSLKDMMLSEEVF
jgi:hypothetical protein